MSSLLPHGAQAANADVLPKIGSLFDFSAEALGELRTWLEQNPPAIPVTQIVGYQTNTVRVYKKAPGVLAVTNTVAETSVLSESIPGGTLNTLGVLRLTVMGDFVNNGAALDSLTWRVKFGGSTFVSEVVGTGVNNATVFPFKLSVDIANLGATNSNQGWVERWGMNSGVFFGASTTQTIDTLVSETLEVTVQHSVAQAATTFTLRNYMIEFL